MRGAMDTILQLKHQKRVPSRTSVSGIIRAWYMHTCYILKTVVFEHCTICIIANEDRCIYVFSQSSFLALPSLGIPRRFAAPIVLQCVLACFDNDARSRTFLKTNANINGRILLAIDGCYDRDMSIG